MNELIRRAGVYSLLVFCLTPAVTAFQLEGVKWLVEGPNQRDSDWRQPRWTSCSARPQPSLLKLAESARISGEVVIEATISQQGDILQLSVISGHPLLIPAALDYAKHCRHRPVSSSEESPEVVEKMSLRFRYVGKAAIPSTPIPHSGR